MLMSRKRRIERTTRYTGKHMHNHWRRFIPKQRQSSNKGFDEARLKSLRTVSDANELVDELKQTPTPNDKPAAVRYYQTLLLAQTPRAVAAQWQMDAHKYGFHDRDKRLYELIDFNDSYVALLLHAGHQADQAFVDQLKSDMDTLCRRLNTPSFTAEQFEAITRGLAREVAVYHAAQQLGFGVHMTSRTEDAFGIDMVVTHPETRRELNIDCKTPSAFRHRLEDLVHHGRITDGQLLKADEDDFITINQHRGEEVVPVTLMCVRPDTVGELHDFMFDEPHLIEDLFNQMFAAQGRSHESGRIAKKVVG